MPRLRVMVLMLALAPLHPAYALVLAGTVTDLRGSAHATSSAGLSRPLQIGSTILEGDQVSTDADARLLLRMNDGAILTLGDNAKLTIAAYDIAASDQDQLPATAVLGLEGGVLLTSPGAIARSAPERFTLTTPVAVLSIQGAEVWTNQAPDRLEMALFSGDGLTVATAEGTIALTEPETGLEIVPGEAPPVPAKWDWQRMEAARQEVALP